MNEGTAATRWSKFYSKSMSIAHVPIRNSSLFFINPDEFDSSDRSDERQRWTCMERRAAVSLSQRCRKGEPNPYVVLYSSPFNPYLIFTVNIRLQTYKNHSYVEATNTIAPRTSSPFEDLCTLRLRRSLSPAASYRTSNPRLILSV